MADPQPSPAEGADSGRAARDPHEVERYLLRESGPLPPPPDAARPQAAAGERPASLAGLDRAEEEKRNLLFIDAKHHPAARAWLQESFQLNEEREQNLQLHKFYLRGERREGRLPREAWEYFNRAVNYVQERAAMGELLSVRRILEINALINRGVIPANPVHMIRAAHEIMGVERATGELREVFDAEGNYECFGPEPPLEGFIDKRALYRRSRPPDEAKAAAPRSVADLLLELRNDQPDLRRIWEIRKALQLRLKRSPSDIKGDQTVIIFSTNPALVFAHLKQVMQGYYNTVERILRANVLAKGLDDYVRIVCTLAVNAGSLVDMGHFSNDGMGRTNVRIENWIQLQFGLEPPAVVNVVHRGKEFENGTYVPKGIRIAELRRLHQDAEVDRCALALSRVRSSYVAAGGIL